MRLLMIVLVGFSVAACSARETPAPLLPDGLVGLPMTKRMEGEEAAALIARLHAKSMAPVVSEIGHYGAADPPLTVYVSRFSSAKEAEEQVELMMERIGSGSSGFAHPNREMRGNHEVHLVAGHGQSHAYFRIDDLIYWVAASQEELPGALVELLGDQESQDDH